MDFKKLFTNFFSSGGFLSSKMLRRLAVLAYMVMTAPIYALALPPSAQASLDKSETPDGIGLRTVQASFFQEKSLPILAQPVTSRGRFAFQAPGSLRWEYLYPVHSLLLAHNGRVTKLVEQDGRLAPDPGMSPDAMNLVLEEIKAWLAGRYEDNPAFAMSRPDRKTITLTPKDEGLAAIINRIDLHLSGIEGLLEAVVINEGPNAWTRLSFSEAVLNKPLEEKLFTTP